MKRTVWILIAAMLVFSVAIGVYVALPKPAPDHLDGDAWDYTLLPDEVPADWSLSTHGIITAHDVAQDKLPTSNPITLSASLDNLRELYYARYRPPELSHYFDFSLQVLVYQSEANAVAALARENPGAEWETVSTNVGVGDESRVWHFINPADDPTLSQNIYRVDFRYLNGIGSVTLMGTADVVPDFDEPVDYAKHIWNKMRAGATPKDLKDLSAARLPDLRTLLVSQNQLAGLDTYLGERWRVDSRSIPQWIPNEAFPDPKTREALKQLGRVTGYQGFYVKPLTHEENRANLAESLFQQVTAYKREDSAHTALGIMAGLEQVAEISSPVVVGDETRVWSGLLNSTDADGTTVAVAVHEVDFRVGQYVASVRLQTRSLASVEWQTGQAESLQFALKLAQALADNLRAASTK